MTSGSSWIDQNTTAVIFGAYGSQTIPDTYERLLLDALNGDASLFHPQR